jgi:hypothetical protein
MHHRERDERRLTLGTCVDGAVWLVESLLVGGLMLRAVLQLWGHNALAGKGAGNESFAVGVEADLAVRDHDLDLADEFLARAISPLVAWVLLVTYGPAVSSASVALRLAIVANWLVLVVDPAVGLYARAWT